MWQFFCKCTVYKEERYWKVFFFAVRHVNELILSYSSFYFFFSFKFFCARRKYEIKSFLKYTLKIFGAQRMTFWDSFYLLNAWTLTLTIVSLNLDFSEGEFSYRIFHNFSKNLSCLMNKLVKENVFVINGPPNFHMQLERINWYRNYTSTDSKYQSSNNLLLCNYTNRYCNYIGI